MIERLAPGLYAYDDKDVAIMAATSQYPLVVQIRDKYAVCNEAQRRDYLNCAQIVYQYPEKQGQS